MRLFAMYLDCLHSFRRAEVYLAAMATQMALLPMIRHVLTGVERRANVGGVGGRLLWKNAKHLFAKSPEG